jgi:hypothetical protein
MRRLPTGVLVPDWVRLPKSIDPEDLETLMYQPVTKGVLTYRCPVCRNTYRSDIAGLEPCCTGPTLGIDEHPMEIMELIQ